LGQSYFRPGVIASPILSRNRNLSALAKGCTTTETATKPGKWNRHDMLTLTNRSRATASHSGSEG
jgi:hypothetical protein